MKQNRSVVVTGAGTGIGRAIFERLITDGWRGGVVHFEAAEPGHVAPVEATIEQMSRVEDNDAGGQCRAQASGCAAPPFLQM